MKSLLLALILTISTSTHAWIENEDQFSSHPYYEQMVEFMCFNCGPNEGGYRINDIYAIEETQAEVCYIMDYTVTYDDDYGPVNYDEFQEFCFEPEIK
ncbi:hypothetical protein [Halobacteriovorax sp. DPLXC-1]|uniref:hypothetical protein n=1 Tax=Halobacteriovorax sp. DPLXC-1 TaxID=3110771 RepID=UPI002FF12785